MPREEEATPFNNPDQVNNLIAQGAKLDPLGAYLSQEEKPAFYANGFQAGVTGTEAFIIFMQNNVSKVALTFPMPAIKSLHALLEKMISDYERQFEVKISKIEELAAIQKKNTAK